MDKLMSFIAWLASIILLIFSIKWLWNWAIAPSIDAVNPISFLQALGLYILFALITIPLRNEK